DLENGFDSFALDIWRKIDWQLFDRLTTLAKPWPARTVWSAATRFIGIMTDHEAYRRVQHEHLAWRRRFKRQQVYDWLWIALFFLWPFLLWLWFTACKWVIAVFYR